MRVRFLGLPNASACFVLTMVEYGVGSRSSRRAGNGETDVCGELSGCV